VQICGIIVLFLRLISFRLKEKKRMADVDAPNNFAFDIEEDGADALVADLLSVP